MDITVKRSAQIVAFLLIAAAASQALYTALYLTAPDVNRLPIWSAEAIIFTAMAAFAANPMVHAKGYTLGWGAIFAASILNVMQVGVGLTMFAPFFEAAGEVEAMAPAAGAVVDYSFFAYNSAKVLLAFAALLFGYAKMQSDSGAGKALGGLTALVGIIALIANASSMGFGRDVFGELPLAGGSGVLATVLLALVVTGTTKTEEA